MTEIFNLLRTKHWIKNLFVFIPLFISGNFFDLILLGKCIVIFIMFCLASSSIYIINDIKDVENDQQHPIKKDRPLASGRIKKYQAYAILIALSIFLIVLHLRFPSDSIYIIIGYITLNLIYTFWIKNFPILDIISIAIGFVLRVQAGVVFANLEFSSWLIIMTFTLSMLLALGKRKSELMKTRHQKTRRSLKGYNERFINNLQNIFSTITITVYVLYTFFSENFPGNSKLLLYSSVFVIAGISRYVQISSSESMIEEPTNIFIKDWFIFTTVFLWSFYILVIIYM